MSAAALKSWTTRMLGRHAYEAPVNAALMEKKAVVLVQAKNLSGDPIYAYVELTLASLRSLRAKMASKDDFNPSQYGSILAAGVGAPSQDLKRSMKEKYNLVDLR